MSTITYGFIRGTVAVLAVIGGNLLGGWLLSKYGFKKCIWWFAALLVLPNFLYMYMAFNPGLGISLISLFVVFEAFGDGVAFMSVTMFMLIISRGAYKTSFYAIGTGLMAYGTMLPPMISGKIFEMMGSSYAAFFTMAAFVSLVAFLIVPLILKIDKIKESDREILKENA